MCVSHSHIGFLLLAGPLARGNAQHLQGKKAAFRLPHPQMSVMVVPMARKLTSGTASPVILRVCKKAAPKKAMRMKAGARRLTLLTS
jgi:hypothetical protein